MPYKIQYRQAMAYWNFKNILSQEVFTNFGWCNKMASSFSLSVGMFVRLDSLRPTNNLSVKQVRLT